MLLAPACPLYVNASRPSFKVSRNVNVVFFTDYRAIRMEEKIKEEEEERREAERLAKLPFASTSDEKHLEQLKQERIESKIAEYGLFSASMATSGGRK